MIDPKKFVEALTKNLEMVEKGEISKEELNYAETTCKKKGITFGPVRVYQNICQCGSDNLETIMEKCQDGGWVGITKWEYHCKVCGKIYDVGNEEDMKILRHFV